MKLWRFQELDPHKRLRHKKKWYLFINAKKDMTKKVTPFLNNMNTKKKNVKMNIFENAGENKTLEEYCAKHFKEVNF